MKRQYALNPIINDVYKSTLYQPQQQNHFELVVELTRDLDGGTNENEIRKLKRYLNLAATSFSLPTITTSPIDIPYGNTTIHLAGKTEYGGSGSITCIDYIGADIERLIYNWQMMVTNPETGQMGWAANYKTDAVIIEYAPDGSSLSTWVLRGLWPSEVNYGSLDKSSGDLKQIEITLSYDLGYKKFDDTTGRSGASLALTKEANPANMSAANMAWKTSDDYQEQYGVGDNGPLNDNTTPGPLGAASKNDGVN